MTQLRLDLDLKRSAEPPVPLDAGVRRALVALMATAIVEVWRAEGDGDDDGRAAQP